jgi:thioredoxin 1
MVSHVNITVKPKPHGANYMKKILRFTASWCQPCKNLAKQLEEIDTGLPIEVVDIDVDTELAMDYGIRSVPTLVILDENVEVKRMTGLVTKEILKNWIEA